MIYKTLHGKVKHDNLNNKSPT